MLYFVNFVVKLTSNSNRQHGTHSNVSNSNSQHGIHCLQKSFEAMDQHNKGLLTYSHFVLGVKRVLHRQNQLHAFNIG